MINNKILDALKNIAFAIVISFAESVAFFICLMIAVIGVELNGMKLGAFFVILAIILASGFMLLIIFWCFSMSRKFNLFLIACVQFVLTPIITFVLDFYFSNFAIRLYGLQTINFGSALIFLFFVSVLGVILILSSVALCIKQRKQTEDGSVSE
ncbi:MAG: hypothetical protein IJF11_04635 [Clostridia bacterium]|nr:hypothetical protein [Clostridia bacterium]